jgi:hypothetical protein
MPAHQRIVHLLEGFEHIFQIVLRNAFIRIAYTHLNVIGVQQS